MTYLARPILVKTPQGQTRLKEEPIGCFHLHPKQLRRKAARFQVSIPRHPNHHLPVCYPLAPERGRPQRRTSFSFL